MTKKINKNIIIVSGIAGIVLLVILLSFFSFSQSFITIGTNQAEKVIEDWNGIEVELTAPAFRYVTNDDDKNSFCGEGGTSSISSSYSIDNSLILNNYLVGDGGACSGNHIDADMLLPAGKLTGYCELSVDSSQGTTTSVCTIKEGTKILYQRWENIMETGASDRDGEKEFELIFDKLTNIKIRLNTAKGYSGEASSKMVLLFEPLTQEQAEQEIEEKEAEQQGTSQLPQKSPQLQKPNYVLIFSIIGGIIIIAIFLMIFIIRRRKK